MLRTPVLLSEALLAGLYPQQGAGKGACLSRAVGASPQAPQLHDRVGVRIFPEEVPDLVPHNSLICDLTVLYVP